MFDKGFRNTQSRKYSVFNKWCCKNWISTCTKKKKKWTFILHIHKTNSKFIYDLGVRLETVKLLEGNLGENTLTLALAMVYWI